MKVAKCFNLEIETVLFIDEMKRRDPKISRGEIVDRAVMMLKEKTEKTAKARAS